MPDLLLTAKPLADLLVQLIQKRVERQTTGRGALEAVAVGKQLDEREAPPKRGVEECRLRSAVFMVPMITTFGGTAKWFRSGASDGEPSLVLLDQRDQLTEDLRDVAAVDLVDEDDVGVSGSARRRRRPV